ncbi:MAG: hypothetical protein Q9186_001983 [Xanthomendoza sp. 1 TL-2023]
MQLPTLSLAAFLLTLFTTTAFPLPVSNPNLQTRQTVRTVSLTFQGPRYQDVYYIDAPGDGTPVTISGGALCEIRGADGSVTTLTGSQFQVPVGPPQRQIRAVCISRSRG